MNTDNLDRLQQARDNQDKAVRLIVLQMAYLSGLTTTDLAGNLLDEALAEAMPAPPVENYN